MTTEADNEPNMGGWVMNQRQALAATAIGLALGATCTLMSSVAFGQSQSSVQVPKFQYDPTFPQPLPTGCPGAIRDSCFGSWTNPINRPNDRI